VVVPPTSQSIDVSGTTGTFKLAFNRLPAGHHGSLASERPATGGALPADSLQNALNDLLSRESAASGLLGGTATVTTNLVSGAFLITFGGTLAGQPCRNCSPR